MTHAIAFLIPKPPTGGRAAVWAFLPVLGGKIHNYSITVLNCQEGIRDEKL